MIWNVAAIRLTKRRIKQREWSRTYRNSAKGKAMRMAASKRYRERNGERINRDRRQACSVCGGPKEAGRGFSKCNTCWGVRPEKDLEALIAEQEQELAAGAFQAPERFGDHSLPSSRTTPFDDWMMEHAGSEGEWDDPTADEALSEDDSCVDGECSIFDRFF